MTPPARQPCGQRLRELSLPHVPQQEIGEIVAGRAGRGEGQLRAAHEVLPGRQRFREHVIPGPQNFVAAFDRVPAPDLRQILLRAHVLPHLGGYAAGPGAVVIRAARRRKEREAHSIHARDTELMRPVLIRGVGRLGGLAPVESHTKFVDQCRRDRIRVGHHRIRLIDRKENGVRVDEPPVCLVDPAVPERRVMGLRVPREDLVVGVETGGRS